MTGHRDSVLAVDAHTRYDAIASGGLDLDPTVRVWSDDGLGNGMPVAEVTDDTVAIGAVTAAAAGSSSSVDPAEAAAMEDDS